MRCEYCAHRRALKKGRACGAGRKIVIAALVAVAGYAYFKDDITQLWDDLHVKLAEYPQPKKTVWLKQNVSREKLGWFYHADQGTRTFGIPYEWFMALEQPTIPWLIFTSVDPFRDQPYLDRYGFIPDAPPRLTTRIAASDRLRPGRPDAGSVRRAVAQPARQEGYE